MRPTPPRLPWPLALAIFAVALAVRVWLVDWARVLPPVDGLFPPGSIFDGHERGYVMAFLGQPPDPSTQAWPALTWLYQALGLLWSDVRVLVGFCLVAGAAAAALTGVAAGRSFGAMAGLWTGLLVALLPEHVAWSTSAFNVILPHFFLALAFALPRPSAALLPLLAAVSMRVELLCVGLFRGWPGLVAAAVGVAWLWWLPSPDLGDPLLGLRINLPLLTFLGPAVLWLGLLALWPGAPRRASVLVAAVLVVHLVGSSFLDYGARHALPGGIALCALGGLAAARFRHLPGLVILLGLAWQLPGLKARWYTPQPADLPGLPEAPPADCVEVTGEPPIDGQPMPSHALLWAGALRADCVLWGEAPIHRAWTSRGLQDRAVRMHARYDLEPVALRPHPGGDILLYRIQR